MATFTEATLDSLRHPYPTYRSTTGQEVGSFNVFAGTVYFTVQPASGGASIYKTKLRLDDVYVVSLFMEDMLSAEPNTSKTLVFNDPEPSPEGKPTLKLRCILMLKKDERKVFHVILKADGQTWDFPIRYSKYVAMGTGEIPEDTRSIFGWRYLINYLRTLVPHQVDLTAVKVSRDPNGQGGQGGGNRYGGGGWNRGNRGGYQSRPNPNGEFSRNADIPSDVDMFGKSE